MQSTHPRQSRSIPAIRWLILFASLWLAACTTAPPQPAATDGPTGLARQAAERGDWQGAATQWESAAAASTGPADALWFEAADAWWRAGDALRTTAALRRVDEGSLDSPTRARMALLRGEMGLALADLDQAEFYLSAATGELPRSERQRLSDALTELETLRRDPHARTLNDVATLLDAGETDTATALRVLELLGRVPTDRLILEAQRPTRIGQWSGLTLDLRRTVLERRDLLQAAGEWATLHPIHPVDQQQYMELAWQYGQAFSPPERIAVLLPTSGPLAAAGAAIRDGLLSAWLDYPTRSELTFMPVGEDPMTALEAYRTAERGDHDWVIGPLRRESVQLLVDQPDASLPGLLLNWPEVRPAGTPFDLSASAGTAIETDFFSLALSQEAEAAAVAGRMLADGHRQAILLLADNAWGERAEAAFVDAYLDGGGEVVSLERFRAGDADHSVKLTRLLQIQDGRERRRRLQGLLGLPLEYEDSRRDDFGAFFMAADPTLGRQIKPQLRFFDAGEKPVFAMSRVYTGKRDATSDSDLNGVMIPATRWALREESRDGDPVLSSQRGGAFTALYALGRDAWDVLPWLDTLSRDPGFAFPGATGNLTVGPDGRLLRDPVWAVFQRGQPVPLQTPATPAPAGAP
jgi:outer membrane PBP1 activator LpoA protein